jgi:undecaprenyl-diphosphatase
MNKKMKRNVCAATALLAAFAVWTVLLRLVDVKPIGPEGATVGFATLNRCVHGLTGVHMPLYTVTDWLSLLPFACMLGFAILGLVQWIRRKSLLRVDHDVLLLGGFYLAVAAVYLFFETVVINYRPILIEGVLEASYPSSTTVLVLCVMPTAIMQFRRRIRHPRLCRWVCLLSGTFTVFMTVGRLLSGVHWITDIIGGILISCGLVLLYDAAVRCCAKQ